MTSDTNENEIFNCHICDQEVNLTEDFTLCDCSTKDCRVIVHWNCYTDEGCKNVSTEAQKSWQDPDQECHICEQDILLINQEANMMFCDCDTAFSTFVDITCLRDLGCPS